MTAPITIALFLAMARLPWTGISARFPIFHVFLCLQVIAAIAGFSGPYDRAQTRFAWAPAEAASLVAAVLAAMEIILAMGGAGWMVRLAGVLGVLLAIWAVPPTMRLRGLYGVFLAMREATWIWLAVVLVATLLNHAIFGGHAAPLTLRHACLFTALILAHALVAPMGRWGGLPTWLTAQFAYRIVATGCCVGWTIKAKNG